MPRVCVGSQVAVQLMGYAAPMTGVVDTVMRGISTSNATMGTQNLPSVDAVYTWVRLAQRVPVRVRLVSVPPGVPLVAGMTATVSVLERHAADDGQAWSVDRGVTRIREAFDAVVAGPVSRPGCIPPVGRETGATVALQVEDLPSPPVPARVVKPDLAPGMTTPPRR